MLNDIDLTLSFKDVLIVLWLMTEDEMAGWHYRLDGHESGCTPEVGDGQGAWRAAIHGVTKSQTRLN